MQVRPKTAADQAWVEETLVRLWGGRSVAVHGEAFEAAALPAFIAGEREGLLTYHVDPPIAEIVTLNALEPRRGIGTALVEALAADLAAAASAVSGSRRPTTISTRCASTSGAGSGSRCSALAPSRRPGASSPRSRQ